MDYLLIEIIYRTVLQTEMSTKLDRSLKTVRRRAINSMEEELLIKELLRIIYNRISFYDQQQHCVAFASVFLRQSGLQFADQLATEEYNAYRNLKTFKYRPHVRLTIRSLKFVSDVMSDLVAKDTKCDLTIITSIDGQRKQKKTLKVEESLFTSGPPSQIDCQFIHVLNPKSNNVLISLSLGPSPQNITKYFCGLFQKNKVCAQDIQTESLRGMPLTGVHNFYSTSFHIPDNTSKPNIRAEVELKIEFIDDPKLIRKFRSEKVKSHKNLVSKIYNRWPTDGIPSQMKALIEMNRQQNGLTFEENCILEEKILTETKELSETNKKYKEFLSLINRAPLPSTDTDFGDHFNQNNNGSVPPIQDNKVFRIFRNRNKESL